MTECDLCDNILLNQYSHYNKKQSCARKVKWQKE